MAKKFKIEQINGKKYTEPKIDYLVDESKVRGGEGTKIIRFGEASTFACGGFDDCARIKMLELEIENLKYKNTYLTECALEERKEFQEVLKKCSPIKQEDYWNGNIYEELEYCEFCADWKIYGEHASNCKYIKLTK